MKGYIVRQTVDDSNRPTAVRYAGALLGVLVAVFLGRLLRPVVDPMVLALIAVLVAAWFSGLWPALLASPMATLALDYFSASPPYKLTPDLGQAAYLLTFALIAGLLATASAARRTAERSLEQSRDELDAKGRQRHADL